MSPQFTKTNVCVCVCECECDQLDHFSPIILTKRPDCWDLFDNFIVSHVAEGIKFKLLMLASRTATETAPPYLKSLKCMLPKATVTERAALLFLHIKALRI